MFDTNQLEVYTMQYIQWIKNNNKNEIQCMLIIQITSAYKRMQENITNNMDNGAMQINEIDKIVKNHYIYTYSRYFT